MSVAQVLPDLEGLDETLAPLGRARHAPGDIYGSAEVYELEKKRIFKKDWLCVARADELAKPGDYMTLRLVDEPIVIARDQDNTISAYYNVCAHRGVEVAVGQGNTKEFSCPYHGWLYDLKGRLVGAPFMKDAAGFDAKNCRLRPLKSDEWGGWIFINFDDNAAPLDSFLTEFKRDLGFLRMEDCGIAHKFEIEWKCNWKFVIENLQDVYHFKTVHARTFADKVTAADQFQFQYRARGGNFSRYQGASFTPDGKSLVGPMPWLANEPEDFAVFGLLSPNFHLLGRRDFIRPYFMWPTSPSTSKAVIYHLFPKEVMARPGFAEKAQVYFEWYKSIYAEDVPVVQTLQDITQSDWFRAERMSKMEGAIHHFITGHIQRLIA